MSKSRTGPSGATAELVVACAGVILVVGSMTSLNLALPEIGSDTGVGQTALTWVLDSYTLILACLLLPFGAIGDRFGRHHMLGGGAAVFALGCLVSVVEPSIEALLIGRSISGVGAAMLMPATLAILTTTGRDHAKAVGIWGGSAAVGGAVGVFASGWILEFWSWPQIQAATAIYASAVFLASRRLRPSRSETAPSLDPVGSVLSSAAIGLLTFGIMMVPEHGLRSVAVLSSWVGASGCIVAFLVWASDRPDAIVDTRLFRNRRFSAGAVALILQFVVGYGATYLWMQHFQIVLEISPKMSGLALAPMVGPLLLVLLGDRLTRQFGFVAVFLVGFGAVAASCFVYASVGINDGYAAMVLPLALVGLGLGLMTAPATTALVDEVPAEKQGVASAVNDSAREVGAAVGIALAGTVFTTSYRASIPDDLTNVPEPLAKALTRSPAAIDYISSQLPGAEVLRHGVQAAYISGQQSSSIVLGGIAVAGAVIVPLMFALARRSK